MTKKPIWPWIAYSVVWLSSAAVAIYLKAWYVMILPCFLRLEID